LLLLLRRRHPLTPLAHVLPLLLMSLRLPLRD
jgi:hypothetical protein